MVFLPSKTYNMVVSRVFTTLRLVIEDTETEHLRKDFENMFVARENHGDNDAVVCIQLSFRESVGNVSQHGSVYCWERLQDCKIPVSLYKVRSQAPGCLNIFESVVRMIKR